jgi:hypothetical protein
VPENVSVVPVIIRSLAAAAVAAGLLLVTPTAFGTYGLRVHVRWTADVTTQERQRLERQLQLADAQDLGNNTFRYLMIDSSTSAIRTLVTHPSAADTHYIDRALFTAVGEQALFEWVDGRAGRGGRLLRPLAIGLAWLLGAYAIASAVTASLFLIRPAAVPHLPAALRTIVLQPLAAVRTGWSAAGAFLQRGIPEASPAAAGAFRIVFGVCALTVTRLNPVSAEKATPALAPLLSGYPSLIDALQPGLVIAGLLFIAGVATPISYAAFTVGFLVWATIATLEGGSHALSALAMALVVLLPSRWGDAVSVDAWLWRRRSRGPGRLYGYSIWAPRFVLGVAFAAAAWSKVKAGSAWIANGTVKYHFLSDAGNAYLDWGVRLTRNHHALAVAASAAVVVVEALLLTAAFSRSRTHRTLLAAAAALLFAGFVLFQGVMWPGWWVLFLSFLPWDTHRQPALQASGSSARLTAMQMAIVAAVLLQQIYVSGVSLERPPLLSAYDMYSASYDSMEDYERSTGLDRRGGR